MSRCPGAEMIEKTIWTPELDTRLRELHEQNLVYLQIAAIMNANFGLSLTRNACIGRGRRIGLSQRAASPTQLRPPKPRKKRVYKQKPRPEPVAPPIVPEVPELVPGQLTMLQLDRTTCRWPSGTRAPYFYCGEPVHGTKQYCEEHCRMAYHGSTR